MDRRLTSENRLPHRDQTMGTDNIEEALLQQAYDSLKAADLDTASDILDRALGANWEHAEIRYALKCVNWWKERDKKLADISENSDRGDFYLAQWGPFLSFLDRLGKTCDRCVYAIRHYVFASALACFTAVQAKGTEQRDPGLLVQLGRCNKWTGNYEQALKHLEEALRLAKDDAACLAELADVNALINEVRVAKALFREAFFLDPRSTDLRYMESDMIRLLAQRVQALGWQSPELEEWIPVYGTIWHVFNVKRELRAIELGRLKQSIFTLENEVRLHSDKAGTLVPRLINRYFWLIDHYVNTGEDRARIQETLLKIKLLDEGIYKQYTGSVMD